MCSHGLGWGDFWVVSVVVWWFGFIILCDVHVSQAGMLACGQDRPLSEGSQDVIGCWVVVMFGRPLLVAVGPILNNNPSV